MIDILAALILIKPFALENQVYQWLDVVESKIPSEYLELIRNDNTENDCLVARVAYDIGSSNTKIMGALVDICKMKVDKVFTSESYPLSFRQDLSLSEANEFSPRIKNEGIKALAQAKNDIEQKYLQSKKLSGVLQHCAVATAAFRSASNGEDYVHELEEKAHIPINVISQEDEGKLAYLGAIANFGQNEVVEPIVWDIGGGSMQLTFKNQQDEYFVMGGEMAANTFQALVQEKVLFKALNETPYPMNHDEIVAAIDLAKHHLTFDEAAKSIIQTQIEMGSEIIAVGAVHNYSVLPLCNLVKNRTDKGYSKQDIQLAIYLLTDKDDAEIINLFPMATKDHVKNQLTNLILVYAMMDLMGIESVKAVQTSNVQGLLLKGC